MRKRRLSRLLVAGLAAALAGLALGLVGGVSPVSSPAAAASVSATCSRGDFGDSTPPELASVDPDKRPVVFVHGWTGRPLEAFASAISSQLGGDIIPMVFDYSKWSAYWASDDHIAPCLAKYLHQVSDAYAQVSGDHRIVYVAHSMGGIAIRYAMDTTKVASPVTAEQVPWVITIDTPHLGSPWGGLGVAQAKELFLNGFGNSVPNPFGVDGGRCLALHADGSQLAASCGGLPSWLAGGNTLFQIGGSVTVRRTFLGIHLYDIPLESDGIVDYSSETGYLRSGPGGKAPVVSSPTIGTTVHSQRVDCSVTTGQLSASIAALGGALSSAGLPVSLVSDWDALHRVASGGHDPVTLTLDGVALFTAGCSHTNILNNRDAISQVANDIRKILTAAAPPLLGLPWATYQAGFGHVAPKHVFNGGDPTGAFTISWDNWGGPTADGHGTALWVGPKDIVADGHREPARFRAYDLGTCNGKKVYLHMAVWFPQHGQTFDPATNGETTYTFCPAHASPQTVTVTGNDGRRYTATVVAQDQIRDCAANAHGSQLITFLTAHPCGRGAWRRLFTINLAGRTVALSSISLLEPGLTKPGQPPQPYIYAEQLRALELAPGTGGINDLLQAGVRPVGWPAQIPLNEAFDVLEEDAGLAILDAWYLNGETSPSAPELRSLEDALFPTALTTTSP